MPRPSEPRPMRCGLRLYKREKLCSGKAIEHLFARGAASASGLSSSLAYPLRALWMTSTEGDYAVAPVPQFLISVPKRRLRHAVERVRMRRLVREAWRHHRELLPEQGRLSIAFVYVADRPTDYARVERAVSRLLTAIARSLPE